MTSDQNTNDSTTIHTSGGSVISGNVNTGGGDFVARDKISVTEEIAYSVHGLENPYLGLRAFGYKDRDIYAGRDAKITEALAKLTTPGQEQAMLFVTGASGSGKSSFVQAGLLPRLEEHYAQRHTNVRIAIFRPRDQPLAQLDDALRQLAPDAGRDLAACTAAHQVNLLVIDQFEEVFTQAHLPVDAEFFQWLQRVPPFHVGRSHIIATIRADYLNELFNIAELYDLNRNGLDLRAMREDELREAIQRPLQVRFPNGDRRFEPALVEKLAQDAGASPTLLPLLQVTLQTLWKRGSLKLAVYTNLTDAIQQRAEAVYAFRDHDKADPETPRPPHEQQELMQILLDLIHVAVDESDRRDVRQPRTRRDLEGNTPHRPQLIEGLVNARLLAITRETVNGEDVDVVDIIHESLIDNWERLQAAIDEQRQQLQRRASFKLWLGKWVRNGRQDGYLLLTDMQLAEARALVEARDIEVQGGEAQAFYQQSVERRETERQKELQRVKELAEAQRQQARVFRNGVIVAALLLLASLIFAGWGWRNSITATNNEATAIAARATSEVDRSLATARSVDAQIAQSNAEQQAEIAFSRHLAAQSSSDLSNNRYESSILFAIESGRITTTLEAFSAIRSAIANPAHSRTVFYGHTAPINRAIWSKDESKILTSSDDGTVRIGDTLTGKELVKFDRKLGKITQATWNQDESKIFICSDDGAAYIWDVATDNELLKLDGVSQAVWNQRGNKILTSNLDGTASIWDAIDNQELLKLEEHTGWLFPATWNHDESKILTNSENGTLHIWDSLTGQKLLQLDGHTAWLFHATWNHDESRILTSSGDGTARIWDATDGQKLLQLEGHMDFVTHAIWNHDESKVLTSSTDGTARIWDVATGEELLKLEGHTSSLNQVAWNRDESKILTIDGTARIWDATTGQELVTLEGHVNGVTQATWNQDGSRILTGDADGTVRIWDAATGEELHKLDGHSRWITQAIWNQNERKILTSSEDGTSRIWDVETGQELVTLIGHIDFVNQATWNPDESKILTSSNDSTARIWDAATGQELYKLEGNTGPVSQAIWNRNGSKVLTISNDRFGIDNAARIWDTATSRELLKLEGHTGGIRDATWSQDSNRILTLSDDRTARIWDAETGQELSQIGEITHATWNQDENKILTASEDNTARIWNAATGQELLRFNGHTKFVSQATWNHDESKVLTTSGDGTARIWDAATGQELLRFNGHTDFVSQATWNHDESKILTISRGDGTARIWNAISGQELVKLDGVHLATWNQEGSKILTTNPDYTAHIWDAATGQELVKLDGHTGSVWQAIWNHDESKILTNGEDGTARIWDAATGQELVKLDRHTRPVIQAIWNQDESKILTSSWDGTVKVWYTEMHDLVIAACQWTPRNFTWAEWSTYMADNVGTYRPTCPNAPIPPDAIEGIQDEARQFIRNGQLDHATQRLTELNGWLQVNGQFQSFGVDVDAFVAEVSATATAKAKPSTPTPTSP